MKLTLAEFACFNLKSKQQILKNKAVHISSIALDHKDDLLLFSMNEKFVTMQINRATHKPVSINSLVTRDMLYLFSSRVDISGLFN